MISTRPSTKSSKDILVVETGHKGLPAFVNEWVSPSPLVPTLEGAGYGVLPVWSGYDAIALWSGLGTNYSLVITDLNPPKMSARELVGELISRGAKVPFLIMIPDAGYEVSESDWTGLPVDFLHNPYKKESLLRKVSTLLRRGALRSETV